MTDDAEAGTLSTTPTASADSAPTRHQSHRIPALTAAVAVLVVAADQLTKRWALSELTGREPRHVAWTLQWNLTRNSGMAFSKAQGVGPLIGVVAMVVVLWLAWSSRKLTGRITTIAAGLIAGGAIGNLADRLFRGGHPLRGSVIDFIDFQWFPIFNIADMAIDIGGALFVLWTILAHRTVRAA
ncbi:MAG TPA: signal peptidase II [Ilumatobacteraceae bacterium]|nr:signal peptidase II [Ilumatobacteraceae bacterium]